MLTENEELVIQNNKIVDTFNEFFGNIVEDLDLNNGRTVLNLFQILNLLI